MAYGDSRTEVASDTFDSSISADWENGGGSWTAFSWVTGGHIDPVASSVEAGMRRQTETFADDQYSITTVQSVGSQDYVGAATRMQAGTDESAYVGVSEGINSRYAIYEVDSTFTFNLLANTATGWAALSAGQTCTVENEGTTIRLGDNRGTDTERLTTTDATITSGDAGLASVIINGNGRLTAWSGGDIGAAGGGTLPNFLTTLGVG